jgi:hypothetical protein
MSCRTAIAALALLAGCKDNTSTSTDQSTGARAPGGAAPSSPNTPQLPNDTAPVITWVKHAGKNNAYAIELPGKPSAHEQPNLESASTEFGSSDTDPRTSLCGVNAMKLPGADPKADPKAKADPSKLLEGATAKHKENATIVEDKEVTLVGHPGRSLIVDNTAQRKWIRAYVVDETLYILKCAGPVERATVDEVVALKTLSSFTVPAKKK